MPTSPAPSFKPGDVIAVSPAEAARLASIGRTTIYRAISGGELRSLKVGKRRLIAVESLRQWLLSHEISR